MARRRQPSGPQRPVRTPALAQEGGEVMKCRILGAVAVLLAGRGPDAVATPYVGQPESLIPATAQVYVRWDGIAAHREQYAQTAIGQLLTHDLAPLRQQLLEQFP